MTAYVRGISADGRAVSIDQSAIHEYTIVYKVYTDNVADGPSIVESAFGVPKIGDIYASGNDLNTAAFCKSKSVSQAGHPTEWEVTCTFTNAPISITGVPANPAVDNPLNAPADISYIAQNRSIRARGYFTDPETPPTDKQPADKIRASNGELVDPQPEMDIGEPVMNIKRNVQTISAPTLMGLANCVNSDYWQNAEPRQLKLMAPQAVRKFSPVCGFYWEVSYQIAFRWETWDFFVQNEGSYYWNGGKPNPIAATDWSDPTKFKRKYRDGQIIIVNMTTGGDINTTATPTWSRYRVYREVQFDGLGLI